MNGRFRILVAPTRAHGKEEWAWQAVNQQQTIASGYEDNVLEAMESAAVSLGFWLDTHPGWAPVAVSVDVEFTEGIPFETAAATGGAKQ